jgi:hypothetical protein
VHPPAVVNSTSSASMLSSETDTFHNVGAYPYGEWMPVMKTSEEEEPSSDTTTDQVLLQHQTSYEEQEEIPTESLDTTPVSITSVFKKRSCGEKHHQRRHKVGWE